MNDLPSLKYLIYRDFENDHIPEIIDEIYLKGVYRPYVLGKKDLIIADFGANQGLTASYFYPYAKKIYAVEPSREHNDLLEHLIELNGYKNIKLCPYAISNKNGKTNLNHTPNRTAFTIVENVIPQEFGNEEVETVTIEEFFKREKIDHLDILKLDIEGMEGKVVASKGFASVADKIDVILGEYHDWSGMSKGMFMNTFRDLGFNFKWDNFTTASTFTAVRI